MTNEPFKVGDFVTIDPEQYNKSSVIREMTYPPEILMEVVRVEELNTGSKLIGFISPNGEMNNLLFWRFNKCHPIIDCDGDDDDCV